MIRDCKPCLAQYHATIRTWLQPSVSLVTLIWAGMRYRDAFLHRGDVGDNADGFSAGLKVLQRRHRDFQGVRIQRAEAFVISTKGRMSFTVCQSASWIAWSRASENSAR